MVTDKSWNSYFTHRIIDSVPSKLFIFEALHDFSVLLRTGSNPPDIYRLRSNTGNIFIST